MTVQQAVALRKIAASIIEAISPDGGPSGVVYAALMAQGCTLHQYEQIISGLKQGGMIEESQSHWLMPTAKGLEFIKMIPA